jgi:hypothetical protein
MFSVRADYVLGPLHLTEVFGPMWPIPAKVLQFFEEFCAHRSTALKADGRDIISVSLVVPAQPAPSQPAPPDWNAPPPPGNVIVPFGP